MLNNVLTIEAKAEKEWIAGISRQFLYKGKYWTGFKDEKENKIFELINEHLEFRPRNDEIENDETFKQIIPYFLIKNKDKYFSSRRKSSGGDNRAHGKVLIGFGGHLRKEDIKGPMKDWLKREFEEEIQANEIQNISFAGIVNDDSDATNGIGKVHFGLVFIVKTEEKVEMKEKEKFEEGSFKNVDELKKLQPDMESWSQLITQTLE